MKPRKAAIIKNYFQRQITRWELVEGALKVGKPTSRELSTNEAVAVITLLCIQQPIDDAIDAVDRFTQELWSISPCDDLFQALEQTCLELRRMGMINEGAKLLKLSAVTAKIHGAMKWSEHFEKQIEGRLKQDIHELPYLKQRGW